MVLGMVALLMRVRLRCLRSFALQTQRLLLADEAVWLGLSLPLRIRHRTHALQQNGGKAACQLHNVRDHASKTSRV